MDLWPCLELFALRLSSDLHYSYPAVFSVHVLFESVLCRRFSRIGTPSTCCMNIWSPLSKERSMWHHQSRHCGSIALYSSHLGFVDWAPTVVAWLTFKFDPIQTDLEDFFAFSLGRLGCTCVPWHHTKCIPWEFHHFVWETIGLYCCPRWHARQIATRVMWNSPSPVSVTCSSWECRRNSETSCIDHRRSHIVECCLGDWTIPSMARIENIRSFFFLNRPNNFSPDWSWNELAH